MSANQESVVALLIERLNDPELTVRIHAGLQLVGMGLEAKPALPVLITDFPENLSFGLHSDYRRT